MRKPWGRGSPTCGPGATSAGRSIIIFKTYAGPLAGQSAAAVVIDVQNGDLPGIRLAATFRPNSSSEWQSPLRLQCVGGDDRLTDPLGQGVVQGRIRQARSEDVFGSCALEGAKSVPTKKQSIAPGFCRNRGRRFHCWKARRKHGRINLRGACASPVT